MNRTHSGKVALLISTMMFWFSMYTYVPILTPYVEALGGTLFTAGVVVSSYGLAQLLVRIPIGVWSDRLGNRKLFILGGLACATVSSIGFYMSDSVLMALLFRTLSGIAAGSWVAFTVLFTGYFNPHEAPRAMGVISFYASVAQMAATALGGFVAQAYGWHAPFALGALGGLAGLLAAVSIRETRLPQRPKMEIGSLLRVARHWSLLSVSLLAALSQCVTFTTMFGFTPLYAAHIHASKGQLGLLTFFTTLPNAVAGYLSGTVLARWMGERATAAAGFVLAAAGTAAIPFTHTVAALLVTQAINGFGQGVAMPMLMGLSVRSVPMSERATAMGVFQAVYSLGMFGGPLLVGLIGNQVGLRGGFLIVSAVSAIAAVLCLFWLRSPQKQPA